MSGSCPAFEARAQAGEQDEVFMAGTAIVAGLLPLTLLPWLLKLTKAGDTTATPLLRSWLQPQLLCGTEWVCSFLAHSLPKDRQRGSPRCSHIPTGSLIAAS